MNNIACLTLVAAFAPLTGVFAAPASSPSSKLPSIVALAGYAPLSGEGVVITLSDRDVAQPKAPTYSMPGLVHDYDVLALVNELRFAGAQGIVVGGVRLTNQSSIICIGPRLLVDKTPIAVPLRIEAVGNAALIRARLNIKGALLDSFKTAGPGVQMRSVNQLRLKAAPLPTTRNGAWLSN